jgi:hypothetical protein
VLRLKQGARFAGVRSFLTISLSLFQDRCLPLFFQDLKKGFGRGEVRVPNGTFMNQEYDIVSAVCKKVMDHEKIAEPRISRGESYKKNI